MSADDPLDPAAGSVSDGEPVDWKLVESGGDLDVDSMRALKDVERIADFSRRLQRTGDANDSPEDPGGPPERWGHLMLLERIGAGARGEVWRAWDASLQRQVALKFLLAADFKSDRVPSSDLVSEARSLARIRHHGVVAVYGVATHDRRTGMWMEWIEGVTLARDIERRGALPAREVERIGLALCAALEALESAGVVHRDVKPANIVVETGERVVLTDFGLGWRPALDETRTPRSSGTPIFMAPELLSGGEPSPRSDLYALGVTLWWALAGRSPFRSKTVPELREEAARGPSEPLRTVCADAPEALVDAIEWAMKPSAAERPQSAAALAARLKLAAHEDPATRQATDRMSRSAVTRPLSSRGAKIGLAGVALAGLIVWIIAGFHSRSDMTPSPWTARRLPLLDPGQSLRSISPDGTKIAYLSDSSAALSVFSIDESDTRTVDRLAAGEGTYANVAWSADGSNLVATRCDAVGDGTIVLVDPVTGHRDILAHLGKLGSGQINDLYPSLSPDGALLAIRSDYRPARGVFRELRVLDVRTGAQRTLVRSGANEFILPPTWAPTSARLAYVLVHGYRGYTRVETCDLQGKRTTVVRDSTEGLEPYGYEGPSLQWLEDHRLLYALRSIHHGETGDAEWWSILVDPATGLPSSRARAAYALPGAGVYSPSASKMGRVAFNASRTTRRLTLIGTDGGARYARWASGAQLADMFLPVWSSDGQWLFVGSKANPARHLIGRFRLSDGRFEALAPVVSVRDEPLCLTPDGKELLSVIGSRLVAIPVAGGAPRLVAPAFSGIALLAARSGDCVSVEHMGDDLVVRDLSPTKGLGALRFRYPVHGLSEQEPPTADLSPDGTRLVVLRGNASGFDVLDARTGRVLRGIDMPSGSYPQGVRWSPDGSTLYATGMEAIAKYWIARVGEHGIDRVIWKSENVWAGDPAVSPDGKTLAFATLEISNELWVMEPSPKR